MSTSNIQRPAKPTWSMKRGGCRVDVWENVERDVPHWRLKVYSLRVLADKTEYPYARVHTFLSTVDGEKDEATELAILLREAEQWVEMQRNAYLAKHGRRIVKRKLRRNVPEVVAPAVFAPIHHTPGE